MLPPSNKQFDAIVIGSGATGGCAAQVLCEGGLEVAVIEAGAASESGAAAGSNQIQKRCSAYNAHTTAYFVDDAANPYVTPADRPFSWIRSRVVGGRTRIWAGQSYRMSDLDFKAASRDGAGEDWPLTHAELAPYYARAERALGVTGGRDGLAQLPDGDLPEGEPLDAAALHLQAAFARCGSALIQSRISVARDGAGSSVCVRCGRGDAGCLRHVSSWDSTLAAARRTGRLTLLSGALAWHFKTDSAGKATAVYAIDAETGRHFEAPARMFFLCASTLESTRLMLNSVSPAHPNGFANSSGALGHYLMDHVTGVSVVAALPDRGAGEPNGRRPVQLLYAPRSQNLAEREPLPFLRGYGWQVTSLRARDFAAETGPGCASKPAVFSSRESAFLNGKRIVRLQAFGEMLPAFENYVEIDRGGKRDAWGIPALSIHCAHGANEREMVRHMIVDGQRLAEAAGGAVISIQKKPSEPGLAIHEAGCCRMGANPQTSVLNRFNQCHDAPNVFVTDGSCYPSQGVQNPTLTMMALTFRAGEYALARARNNELDQKRIS